MVMHLEESLTSDDLHFGFKKKSRCSHALFAFDESLKFFTSNGTKLCATF